MIELFFDMVTLKLPFLLSVSRHSCLELVFSLSATFVEANFLFCFCSSWHLQMSLKNWTIKNKKKTFVRQQGFFYKLTKSLGKRLARLLRVQAPSEVPLTFSLPWLVHHFPLATVSCLRIWLHLQIGAPSSYSVNMSMIFSLAMAVTLFSLFLFCVMLVWGIMCLALCVFNFIM